jgi:hypothetical protein
LLKGTDKNFRDPRDSSREKDKLEYYTWLAKLAEKGKIFCIFFADAYAGLEFADMGYCEY